MKKLKIYLPVPCATKGTENVVIFATAKKLSSTEQIKSEQFNEHLISSYPFQQ